LTFVCFLLFSLKVQTASDVSVLPPRVTMWDVTPCSPTFLYKSAPFGGQYLLLFFLILLYVSSFTSFILFGYRYAVHPLTASFLLATCFI
jgi:hypothetical protein